MSVPHGVMSCGLSVRLESIFQLTFEQFAMISRAGRVTESLSSWKSSVQQKPNANVPQEQSWVFASLIFCSKAVVLSAEVLSLELDRTCKSEL